MEIELKGDIITDVQIVGGCSGNLRELSALFGAEYT
jgi:hypothetical protein